MSSDLRDQLQATLGDTYLLKRELGGGGMSRVFVARDIALERDVVVKVLSPELAHGLSVERFTREIKLVAALQDPHIVPLLSAGQMANGLPYFTMPFVQGESLRHRMAQGKVRLSEGISVLRDVVRALASAHRNGVVHRDIKPENVLLSEGGAVVTDFGIGKALSASRTAASSPKTGIWALTVAGTSLGTPAYMAPEQAAGDECDHRADLYSWGMMAYELLAGAHPYANKQSAQQLIAAHFLETPPSLREPRFAVPRVLADIVMRCLEKDAARRPDSTADVLYALDAASTGAGSAAIQAPSAVNWVSPTLLTSVAVLPFVFLSDVDNSRALSLGFADALITIFGNLEDVVVAPTSAILNYAAGAEPAQVCRDLGVRNALQGTVQKLGSHWRVSIQLFDSTTHKVTLSEKHDFILDNVFEVQDEIGRRVVESLQSRSPLVVPLSRDRYSSDPEAYNEFMAGLRESYSDRQDTLRSAAEHLSRAVEHDPDFALAHATLSFVSMNMHFQFDPQRAWLQQAEDHCRLALALDPALPEGHLARAWILWSPAKNFQHAEAIAALEHVLLARPNFERAHNRMATICQHIGRLQEARIAHEQAQRANPKTRTGNLEYFYIYSGDFARAEEAAEAWLRERPENMYAHATRILPPLLSGNLDLAEQRLAAALEQLPEEPWLVTFQGMLYARRRQTDLALQCVRNALDFPRSFGHTHHTYYNISCVYAVLGEKDKAMAWLERSVDTGFACWPFFRIDPHLESLRENPAFKRLVDDLELTYSALNIQRL